MIRAHADKRAERDARAPDRKTARTVKDRGEAI